MKCSQSSCSNEATHRYTWPGRGEMVACAEHAQKAKAIGSAMGCYIEIVALDHPRPSAPSAN